MATEGRGREGGYSHLLGRPRLPKVDRVAVIHCGVGSFLEPIAFLRMPFHPSRIMSQVNGELLLKGGPVRNLVL